MPLGSCELAVCKDILSQLWTTCWHPKLSVATVILACFPEEKRELICFQGTFFCCSEFSVTGANQTQYCLHLGDMLFSTTWLNILANLTVAQQLLVTAMRAVSFRMYPDICANMKLWLARNYSSTVVPKCHILEEANKQLIMPSHHEKIEGCLMLSLSLQSRAAAQEGLTSFTNI
jgi:hypothetical protein